jgi:hypothetical protein
MICFLMAIGSMLRPRWLPQKSFPPYAYLSGSEPHPVRDPTDIATLSNQFRLPRSHRLAQTYFSGVSTSSITVITGKLMRPGKVFGRLRIETVHCVCFKGLILLSAAGVKIRERKHVAAATHARRAAALLHRLMKVPDRAFERALGMSPATLAEYAEAATRRPADLQETAPGQPQPVFNFILGSNSRRRRSGSQKRNSDL